MLQEDGAQHKAGAGPRHVLEGDSRQGKGRSDKIQSGSSFINTDSRTALDDNIPDVAAQAQEDQEIVPVPVLPAIPAPGQEARYKQRQVAGARGGGNHTENLSQDKTVIHPCKYLSIYHYISIILAQHLNPVIHRWCYFLVRVNDLGSADDLLADGTVVFLHCFPASPAHDQVLAIKQDQIPAVCVANYASFILLHILHFQPLSVPFFLNRLYYPLYYRCFLQILVDEIAQQTSEGSEKYYPCFCRIDFEFVLSDQSIAGLSQEDRLMQLTIKAHFQYKVNITQDTDRVVEDADNRS